MKQNKTQERIYKGIPPKFMTKIHKFVLTSRIKEGLGQRKLAERVYSKFSLEISENTISGWIHRNVVPYAQTKTQFKPKKIPSKKQLFNLYTKQELSASKIANKFKTSTVTAINWLKHHNINVRTHKASMNTNKIKQELRSKKLTIPRTNYKKLTPEKAYILGVLAGDGHINKKFIRFEIRKDIEFIKEFSRCLEEVYGIKYEYKYYKPRNSYVLYAASEIISKDLLNLGGFDTYTWEVPSAILNSKNKDMIAKYLRGLYDSEGSVSRYTVSFCSISKKGIEDVRSLLSKLNVNAKLYCFKQKYHNLVIMRKDNLKKFKELVGFTIKRKMARLK